MDPEFYRNSGSLCHGWKIRRTERDWGGPPLLGGGWRNDRNAPPTWPIGGYEGQDPLGWDCDSEL